MSRRTPETGYAPVHGLQLYYEVHGEPDGRPPLVLLHGGGDTIGTSFGEILPALARGRRVVAFEQQGYGHTADVPGRPFTFTGSADDTAALLDHLGIEAADLLGFSNGATIALLVAARHPGRVRHLVLASGVFKRHGVEPAFWEGMARARLEDMPRELKDAYLAVAPRPEDLPTFFEKSAGRMRDFQDVPDDVVRSVDVPTLVVAGDRDVPRPEHAVELFRLLPRASLAVLPATDHMSLTRRVAWLAPMVEAFLDAPD